MSRKKTKTKPQIGNTDDPQGMGAMLLRYTEWLRIRNYSERTVENKLFIVGNFMIWCEERGITKALEVTKPIVECYQRHLFFRRKSDGRPLGFHTQHAQLSNLQSFFKWLAKENYIAGNPVSGIEMPKVGKRLPKHVLSAREAELILAQPDIEDPLGLRDRAILETLYSTGIRRMEALGLHVYDLDYDRGTLIVRNGKGRKDRVVPIGDRALAWVNKYCLEARPSLMVVPDESTLFITQEGGPFSCSRLTHLVRDYVVRAGIGKDGSCHLFRHTMATLMLDAGADTRFIQEILGHTRLETTQMYTQVSIRQLKEVHTATHPAARLGR